MQTACKYCTFAPDILGGVESFWFQLATNQAYLCVCFRTSVELLINDDYMDDLSRVSHYLS